MRRIIERVVTVVTTTTWKISWEEDPLLPSTPLRAKPISDPDSEELPSPEDLSEALQSGTIVLETKEADPPETGSVLNSPAGGLPDDPNSYPFEERK